VLMSGCLGSIGFAFPAAPGAWAATQEPDSPFAGRDVVSVSSDGGFGQYTGEFTTAVKCGMDVTHVLLNDDALGKISKERRTGGWDVWRTALANPSFAEFAESGGGHGAVSTAPTRSTRRSRKRSRTTAPRRSRSSPTRIRSEPLRRRRPATGATRAFVGQRLPPRVERTTGGRRNARRTSVTAQRSRGRPDGDSASVDRRAVAWASSWTHAVAGPRGSVERRLSRSTTRGPRRRAVGRSR
jgi:hypothetical protein